MAEERVNWKRDISDKGWHPKNMASSGYKYPYYMSKKLP